MAGLVAEEIFAGEVDADFIAADVDDKIRSGMASASDLELMGITDINNFVLSDTDVEQTVRYLLEEWTQVQLEAESLIGVAPVEP